MTSLRVRRDGDLWWLGRDRPEKHNALDEAMVGEIDAVLQAAGADIAELKNRGADAALLAMNAGLFERLEAHCWPTIALVDGPALGRRLRALTQLGLRSQRPATTTFDITAQALLFDSDDKYERMTAFAARRSR
ncbi:MAG: enoyl-CoA hydratase [Pseudonocardiales bacterium]|nr:enoyl-CoA hydratase [Pseudonocardiales bacterium]